MSHLVHGHRIDPFSPRVYVALPGARCREALEGNRADLRAARTPRGRRPPRGARHRRADRGIGLPPSRREAPRRGGRRDTRLDLRRLPRGRRARDRSAGPRRRHAPAPPLRHGRRRERGMGPRARLRGLRRDLRAAGVRRRRRSPRSSGRSSSSPRGGRSRSGRASRGAQAGAMAAIGADGPMAGSVGGAEDVLRRRSAEGVAARASRLVDDPGGELFAEVLLPAPRLVVFGADDDARSLVTLAAAAGFEVLVVDHREALLAPERFAEAERRIVRRPEDGLAGLSIGPRTLAVVKTHLIAHDREWARRLLEAGAGYVGLLGPRARAREIVREIGAESDDRVYGPVGLDLGAEGPEQVARRDRGGAARGGLGRRAQAPAHEGAGDPCPVTPIGRPAWSSRPAPPRRMGENKLLFRLDGETLVARAVRRAAEAGLDPVLVVVGHDAARVERALDGLPVPHRRQRGARLRPGLVVSSRDRGGAAGGVRRGRAPRRHAARDRRDDRGARRAPSRDRRLRW